MVFQRQQIEHFDDDVSTQQFRIDSLPAEIGSDCSHVLRLYQGDLSLVARASAETVADQTDALFRRHLIDCAHGLAMSGAHAQPHDLSDLGQGGR